VIAGPARQKLNRMTQFEPINGGEIGTELSDNLSFKLGTPGCRPSMEVFAGSVRSQIL
jgi:hypothetical protein